VSKPDYTTLLTFVKIIDDHVDIEPEDLGHFLHMPRFRLGFAQFPGVYRLGGDTHFIGKPFDVFALFEDFSVEGFYIHGGMNAIKYENFHEFTGVVL